MERCWNHARGHFVDRDGGEFVDASLLLLPLVNFLPADDPRMSATIDAIERELSHDGLVWRRPHGGDTDQGAFIPCTCWLADCRSLQGRPKAATALLERVLSLRTTWDCCPRNTIPACGNWWVISLRPSVILRWSTQLLDCPGRCCSAAGAEPS